MDRKWLEIFLLQIGLFVTMMIVIGIMYSQAHGPHTRILLLALLLSPPGAWIRYFLSQYNVKFPSFPVFTFMVNMCGTCLRYRK